MFKEQNILALYEKLYNLYYYSEEKLVQGKKK
jgi:hypothetical protein